MIFNLYFSFNSFPFCSCLAGNGFPNVIVETNGAYQPDASRNRNPRAPIPIHFVPPGQVTLPDRSGHDPRILSSSSYPTMTFMATLEERLRSGRGSVVPPRNSRPLSISGHSVERNGRGRNLQERFRSSTDEANVRNRLISEVTFYLLVNIYNHHFPRM